MRDDFMERLREEAQSLRYQPEDPFVYARIASRVASRIAEPRSVLDFLGAWFRPVAAGLAVMVMVCGVSFYSMVQHDPLSLLASSGAVFEESRELR